MLQIVDFGAILALNSLYPQGFPFYVGFGLAAHDASQPRKSLLRLPAEIVMISV